MSNDTNTFTVRGTFERTETFVTKQGKDIVTLILGTNGQYPQLIPVKCFGRVAETAKGFSKGDMIEATGELGGREYNGKVYGDIKALSLEVAGGKSGKQDEPPPADDDLPPF